MRSGAREALSRACAEGRSRRRPVLRSRLALCLLVAAVLFGYAPAWAESWRVAGFLVSFGAGQSGSTRVGTMVLEGAQPRELSVAVKRDRRTLEVLAASIDKPFTFSGAGGLSVSMPWASLDAAANVFEGSAVLSGGGLPVRMRVARLRFDSRGVVSMQGLSADGPWMVGGVRFTPSEGRYDRGTFTFDGALAILWSPRVSVTVGPQLMTVRGPLTPWSRLMKDGRYDVKRLELVNGHLAASGVAWKNDGRSVRFLRRPLRADGSFDVIFPRVAPRPRPTGPGLPPASSKKVTPARTPSPSRSPSPPRAHKGASDRGVLDALTACASTALRAAMSPLYPMVHGVIFAAQGVSRLGKQALADVDPLRAWAFVPADIAQADPLRFTEGLIAFPGSDQYAAAEPTNPMKLRMTPARPWVGKVPLGYVTLGAPAMRVYARNVPRAGDKVDIGRATLSWQTRNVNVKSYFSNTIDSLKLDDKAPVLEQKKGFWGKRAVENKSGTDDPADWFFTGTYNAAKPVYIFGQQIWGTRLQANEGELGQVSEGKLPRIRLFGIGPVAFYLNFNGTNVTFYDALYGTQLPDDQRYSGFLFESNAQVPGFEIEFADLFVFNLTQLTSISDASVMVLLRYTSNHYFKFCLHSDNPGELKFYIIPVLLSLTPKEISFEHFPAGNGRPIILSGIAKFLLELGLGSVVNINADCTMNWGLRSLTDWGLTGGADVGVKVWIINVSLVSAAADLNFGQQRFRVVADSVISKYSPLAVTNLGFDLQLGKAIFEKSKTNTWDNYMVKFSVTAKFLWVLEVPISLWVWADGALSLSFNGADPIHVDPNSNEFKGDLTLFGIKLSATYTLKRSSDGASTEMFVYTEPAPPFTGSDAGGGSVSVSGLRVLKVADGGGGNVMPVSGGGSGLLSGARIEAGFDVTATSDAYDGKKITIKLPPTELTVDGSGSASAQALPVTIDVDGNGSVKGEARIEMASTDKGGQMTLKVMYPGDKEKKDKIDLYTFKWPAGK